MQRIMTKVLPILICFLSYPSLAFAVPAISFESNSSSGTESIGTVKLEVTLSEASSVEVSVPYTIAGGSARNGVDYELEEGVLVFSPGELSKDIRVLIYDDGLEEGNEDIVVSLGVPSNADPGNITEHTYTILDNDGQYAPIHTLPTLSFSSASSSGLESVTSVEVPVELSEESLSDVTVHYEIIGVSAEGGTDFIADSGTLTVPAGETTESIIFTVNDDSLSEPDETLTIILSNPENADLVQPAFHSYTIEDDDKVEVNFVNQASEVEESDQTVTIGLELSRPSELPITVYYGTGGSASPPLDYELPEGQVVFEPGTTQKDIELVIKDDDEIEDDEDIQLALEYGDNVTIGERSAFTFTIRDNDAVVPYVFFSSGISTVPEDSGEIEIEVGLSEPTDREVSVEYYVTEESTAISGNEYIIDGTTITFPPGITTRRIPVQILEDDIETPDRRIVIGLRRPVNAKLGDIVFHTLWRVDNDQEPENLTLFKQEVASRYPPRMLVVVGPKTMTVQPGGVAVDDYGNLYITDQGPTRGENEGSILMWPKGARHVIRIISNVGLTRPGDIELSKDQRTLIVADPKGIHLFPLGLSVRLTNIDALSGNTRVHVFSSTGEKVAKVSPDGYFHFTGILVPGQGPSVRVTIEHGGQTKSQTVFLGQPGMKGDPIGHTVVNLEF